MIRWVSSLSLFIPSPIFPNSSVFLPRTCVSPVSSSSFTFLLLRSFRRSRIFTFLAGPNGRVQRGVLWAICSLLDESRRSSVSPSVPPPFSFCRSLPRHFLRRTFAEVFPLSSRKKFFYNFWIVLFRLSRFFQPRAARSPRVSFIPSSSAALPTATHIRLCFLLSRFHLVQPFLCYLAFSHGLSLSFRQRLCFLFWVNCTRSADWRSFN